MVILKAFIIHVIILIILFIILNLSRKNCYKKWYKVIMIAFAILIPFRINKRK